MKKFLVIIVILLAIFFGMYIYKYRINNSSVTANEVQDIEKYISKIYLWSEVCGEALPKFDDINNANDKWVWEAIKQNLDKYTFTKEDVENEGKELFGDSFKKEFPKEGAGFIFYDEETGLYSATGMGLDADDDSFFINKVKKTEDGYIVDIVEYLVDYSEEDYGEDVNNPNKEKHLYVKNLDNEIIETINEGEESKIVEAVKNNIDKFSRKTLTILKAQDGKLFLKSVK